MQSAFARRIRTFPLIWFGAAGMILLGPVLLVLTLLLDIPHPRRLPRTRFLLFLALYLCAEAVGSIVALTMGGDPARNYALQRRWAAALGEGGLQSLYGVKVEVEGAASLVDGPYLLLLRHAALPDTLLPMLHAAIPHRLRPRYVLKRELLYDPCLDIVGNRLPNVFVSREGGDAAGRAAIVRLAAGMGAGDFAVIYPEGTRATPEKRARVLATLDGEQRAWAERLRVLLPPRPGGVLALLEGATTADVVFCAHAGLESVTTMADLWRGTLWRSTWRVRYWRVPRAEIPDDAAGRTAWLRAWWERLDAWVVAVGR